MSDSEPESPRPRKDNRYTYWEWPALDNSAGALNTSHITLMATAAIHTPSPSNTALRQQGREKQKQQEAAIQQQIDVEEEAVMKRLIRKAQEAESQRRIQEEQKKEEAAKIQEWMQQEQDSDNFDTLYDELTETKPATGLNIFSS